MRYPETPMGCVTAIEVVGPNEVLLAGLRAAIGSASWAPVSIHSASLSAAVAGAHSLSIRSNTANTTCPWPSHYIRFVGLVR